MTAIIAYCAGVIDSDGTIGIKCNSYSARVVKDCRNASYSARICVRQVTTEALEILQATFGGSVRPAKTYAKRGRLMYSWEIRDQLAERALKRLMPHLRIKKAQAQNCLALRILIARSKRARMAKGRGHAGASHRPQDITDAMEIAFNNAKKLNRVGVQP